jgi:site-specific DNA recombinase
MPETAEAALRLAIYARVSTEEQREGQTIDSQIAELERFSRDKGWPITGVYKDEGWSGGMMERPSLDRLRDDARNGLFGAVLINDVDRLARDVAHLGVIKRDLERSGVKVIFRKLPSDTSPTSNLMVNILGSFAEFERELISDRTRRGRRHKVEVRKQYLGSNTSYGYRYVPKDRAAGKEGLLAVIPEEAAVVGQMFQWVDEEGLSARRVLNRLNELKIAPRNRAPGWARSSVLRVLKNEMYAGTWHYNKYQGCEPKNPATSPRYRKRAKCSVRPRPRSEWLPLDLPESLRLVPRDRWERVQAQLSRNIAFSPRNEKHNYLLKGLIRCGACGARYTGDPGHGKFYYRCIRRCKKMPSIVESRLNDAVKSAVREAMLNPAVILDPLRKLNEAAAHEANDRRQIARAAELEARRLDGEEERIFDAYRAEMISPAQLGQQLEKLKVRRVALDQQRTAVQPQASIPSEQIDKTVTEYCAEAAQNLATFNDERWREFLRTIIQTIVFNGDHIRIQGQISFGGPSGVSGAEMRLETELGSA